VLIMKISPMEPIPELRIRVAPRSGAAVPAASSPPGLACAPGDPEDSRSRGRRPLNVDRLFIAAILAAGMAASALPNALGQSTSTTPNSSAQAKPTADSELVLLDTDIGDDIDDAFALSLALKSPEVKFLGVSTTFGDTDLRARLVDRYLSAVGRFDIPITEGQPSEATRHRV